MAETLLRGPGVSIGSLMDGRVEGLDGPSLEYQGDMVPDPRFSPANKDSLSPGAIKAWFSNPYFALVDGIPSASSSVSIAASQAIATTLGLSLNLVTAQAGTAAGVQVAAPGIPIINALTGAIVTGVTALDFGFTTGTTAANSTTVIVVDNSLFTLGQWVCIPGVGGTTTTPLFTQVQSKSTNTTVITVSPAPQTAVSNIPIGQANLYNTLAPPSTQFGPQAPVPNAVEPYKLAGFGLAFDPAQAMTRNISVTASSTGSGTTAMLVVGYDVYGFPMQEVITATGTTAAFGKKAFKYISMVTVNATATTGSAASIAIGHSDVVGFNVRSDKWEYANIFWNGGFAINNTGWTKALATAASTNTADVRGTQNLSTAQIGTSATASTDGVRRLTIMMSVPLQNMINATPLNTVTLLGTAQI